jgi:arylsulfatase A-like enzyme
MRLLAVGPEGPMPRRDLRHQFAHACDVTPTLLELIGIEAPTEINGVGQMPIEGTSFAPSLRDATLPSKARPQHFEMFGHRGLWHGGWNAVAYHPPGTAYENDKWELFHLDEDFSETNDLAASKPEKLSALVKLWWEEAEKHNVPPLDDRLRERFIENASCFQVPVRATCSMPEWDTFQRMLRPMSAVAAI